MIARQIPRLYIPESDDDVEWEPGERLLRDRIRDALWYHHRPEVGRGRKKRRTRRHERR